MIVMKLQRLLFVLHQKVNVKNQSIIRKTQEKYILNMKKLALKVKVLIKITKELKHKLILHIVGKKAYRKIKA